MFKYILVLLAVVLFTACEQQSGNTGNEAEELPNIVLIIGDDHGYPYFGFMGDDYVQTPQMDKLAESGIVFENGYVPANHCAPSLQTLMTGTVPYQHQDEVNKRLQQQKENEAYLNLLEDEKKEWERNFRFHAMKYFNTLPRILREKGYVSWQGGKWWEFNYQNGGFDEGMTKGWTKEDEGEDGWFLKFMGGEGTELVRKTMQPFYEFVDQNSDKPMFIWFAPELPHYPLNAPDEYYNIYKDQDMTESAKRYYANCTWFDDGLGNLMKYLKKKGEFDNTLFVYVNDNGWEQAPNQEFRHDSLRWHNGGDKGKLSMYDMSFRTPIIFSWKDQISEGSWSKELMHSADIPATILDYAGIDVPKDYFGYSYRDVIEGEGGAARQEIIGNVEQIRWEGDMMGRNIDGYWLRDKDWFFSWNLTTEEVSLFDMKADPNNDLNVADQNPEKVEEYSKKVQSWRDQLIN